LMGVGVGAMLTSSVNVVQGSFPEREQGEISGLSRSVSNLGSSLGTALAGSLLVSSLAEGNKPFLIALAFISSIGLVGLGAAVLLPPPAGRAEQTAWSQALPERLPGVPAPIRARSTSPTSPA